MACNTETNYRLEAVTAVWGHEEVTEITPAMGLAGGEYFSLSSPTVDYYCHITVNSTGADPAPASKTKLFTVNFPTSYTAAQAVDALVVAFTSAAKFQVTEATDGLSLCVTGINVGAAKTAPSLGTATGFTLVVNKAGDAIDIGNTEGGMEISFEPTLFDVVPNQNGVVIADQILQGFAVSVSTGLIQMSTDRWESLIGDGFGNKKTPAGGTEVVGFGTGKVSTSSYLYAGRLTLHPVRLAANILTDDITIWKCVPSVESINMSGTDLMVANVTFTALVDTSKDSKINIMARGDATQYLV